MKKILSSSFRISQRYKGAAHRGIDLVAGSDKTVYAPAGGKVVLSGWQDPNNKNAGFGQRVWWTDGMWFMVVGHLSSINVRPGDQVAEGQPLGMQGSTGTSTGPHVHFEVRVGGTSPNRGNLNPALFLGLPNAEGAYTFDDIPSGVDLIYKVSSISKGDFYPEVRNLQDYAGSFGKTIDRVYLSSSLGNVHYCVMVKGAFLPEVMNHNDFAGIKGVPITAIAIRSTAGTVRYRAHETGGGWLPWVTGYDLNDLKNGYAGRGKPLDAIQAVII